MGWQLWLILSSFLAGYCVGETVHLVQEIRAYRCAKREKPCLTHSPVVRVAGYARVRCYS